MRLFDIFNFFDNTKSYSEAISPNSFFKLRKSTSHRFAEPLNATRHESSTSKIPLPLSLSLIRKSEKKKLTAVSKLFSKTIFPYDTHIGRRIVSDHDRANRKARFDLTGPITNPPPPLDPSRLARRNANDSGIPRKEKVVSGWR